ncbi:tetratricopeptide repeat protein [Sphingobium sp. LB126]|uniref:tetratricopeptide repeat protein n=1 Tax=Sphingobium sp. LB126 TaxID=1983755 RepID=UPI001F5BC952|nr:tetratricopeptide repeat protein [Sphingobium sp. LB126]
MGWGFGRVVLMGAVGIAAVSIGYNMMHTPDEAKEPAAPSPLMNGQASDPEAVIRGLQDRVGANPNDAEGWQRLGWAYFENGRHADALRAYRHATKLVPGNATFWSSLGEAGSCPSMWCKFGCGQRAAFSGGLLCNL